MAVITGITLAVLVGLAALAVDIGFAFVRRTAVQAAADMAVLSAGWLLPTADLAPVTARTNQALTTNAFGGAASSGSPTIGLYTPDPTLLTAARYAAGGRWTCGGLASNAVQLHASTTTPVFLGGVFGRSTPYAPGVVATATRNVDAAFRVGSGLLTLNQSQSPVLNAVLNQLLHTGSNINLSAVDYNNLLNANVSALSFANTLATQLQLTAGTYTGLLDSNASVGQIIAAEISALNSQGSIASAAISSLQKLQQQLSITGTPRLTLGQVLDFGAWNSQMIGSGSVPPAVFGTLNVYDLLSFVAQAANGSNAVSINLGTLNLGVATLSGAVTMVEPVQPAYYAFGRPCTSVHTAQVRAQLNLSIGQNLTVLGINLGTVSLPIYVEVASGTANLVNVSCPTSAPGNTTVTIRAQSNVGSVTIGTVPANMMNNFATAPTPQSAALVSALGGLVTVTASAQIPLLQATKDLSFTFAAPASQNAVQAQQISSTSVPVLGSTLYSLLNTQSNGLQVSVNLLGVPLLNVAAVKGGVLSLLLNTVLGGTTSLLDSVVQSLLAALGISVGNVTVFALGARCGPPILVQ